MAHPYYDGDNVSLRFSVTDSSGPVNPTVAKVIIVKPDKTQISETDATIIGNEVSYIMPIEMTNQLGWYRAYFVLTLPGSLTRTHKMSFKIVENPKK